MLMLPASRSIRRALERALFWFILALVLAAPAVLLGSGLLEAIDSLVFLLAEVSLR